MRSTWLPALGVEASSVPDPAALAAYPPLRLTWEAGDRALRQADGIR
jgi:hypothetical protein